MNPLLRGLLAGAGSACGAVAALRREAYRREIIKAERVPLPVVSIGAITCGGAGKTPVTRYVARRLLDDGLRVSVLCGGYLGTRRRRVTALDAREAAGARAAERYGDEAVMLARCEELRDALVICGRDRVAAARMAARAGAQVAVLDDGFQHLRLRRDLDMVLLGGMPTRGLADLRREGPSALAAADLTWCHLRGGEAAPSRSCADVVSRSVAGALVHMDGTVVGRVRDLRGARVFLIAGIANPEAFGALVHAAGAEIVGTRWVGDHRPIEDHHLRYAARAGADLILCTEKDLARTNNTDLTGLTVELELLHGGGRLSRALESVSSAWGHAC